MKKTSFVLMLAAAISACSDLGVPPSVEPPVPPHYIGDFIHVGEIPGILTSVVLTDSAGTLKTVFSPSEPVFLKYSARNLTGQDQVWATGMSYPFARFFIEQGSDTLADSFAGFAFLAVPSQGTLKAGDSLVASWRVDPAKIPLTPGAYMAIASPRFGLEGLGVPGDSWRIFNIRL